MKLWSRKGDPQALKVILAARSANVEVRFVHAHSHAQMYV